MYGLNNDTANLQKSNNSSQCERERAITQKQTISPFREMGNHVIMKTKI